MELPISFLKTYYLGFSYHMGNLIYQQNCCRCHASKVLCTQTNDISLTYFCYRSCFLLDFFFKKKFFGGGQCLKKMINAFKKKLGQCISSDFFQKSCLEQNFLFISALFTLENTCQKYSEMHKSNTIS